MKYSEKKAAQVAAFFVYQAGGTIEVLKLTKLMYLSERESFSKYGEPLTGDKIYSMTHGPVLSITLDHINDFIESEEDGWDSWISDRENHLLGLTNNEDPTEKLTQLSDADIEILDFIWKQYGHLSKYEIRDLSHKICTEWEDPNNSSIPIPYSRLLKCVGYEPEIAIELEERIKQQRKLESIFEYVVPTDNTVSKAATG